MNRSPTSAPPLAGAAWSPDPIDLIDRGVERRRNEYVIIDDMVDSAKIMGLALAGLFCSVDSAMP